MTSATEISKRLDTAVATIASLRRQSEALRTITRVIVERLKAGGTIYTCGNGGSAAEAMHLAEELIGRYRSNRQPLPAICLNADPTGLTCIANDFGFDEVFSRQCKALLTERDVLIVFSTSGESGNIVNTLNVCRSRQATAIALLGQSGGSCRDLADHALVVASEDSGHIQEAHQVVLHIICEAVEYAFT